MKTKENDDKLFNQIYKIEKKISAGSFGIVYSGFNIITNELIAIKIEHKLENDFRSLLRESHILKKLTLIDRVPKLIWSGFDGENDVLILNLLGKDLSSYIKIYKKFCLKTVVMIANQMISILEEIHNSGVIHRDLKPENILFGKSPYNSYLYLIDFGISKIYKDTFGRHIPYKDKKSFIGTARYASIAAHDGIELSRKDDLESLGYLLIFFAKGTLAWQNLNIKEKNKYNLVGNMKKSIKIEELCKNLPEEFIKYFNYVKGLSFKQNPDYNYLKELMKTISINHKFELDNIFEWSQPLQIDIKTKINSMENNHKKHHETTFNDIPKFGKEKINKINSLNSINVNFSKKSNNLLNIPIETSNNEELNSKNLSNRNSIRIVYENSSINKKSEVIK